MKEYYAFEKATEQDAHVGSSGNITLSWTWLPSRQGRGPSIPKPYRPNLPVKAFEQTLINHNLQTKDEYHHNLWKERGKGPDQLASVSAGLCAVAIRASWRGTVLRLVGDAFGSAIMDG
jgi:hypothetical protein